MLTETRKTTFYGATYKSTYTFDDGKGETTKYPYHSRPGNPTKEDTRIAASGFTSISMQSELCKGGSLASHIYCSSGTAGSTRSRGGEEGAEVPPQEPQLPIPQKGSPSAGTPPATRRSHSVHQTPRTPPPSMARALQEEACHFDTPWTGESSPPPTG